MIVTGFTGGHGGDKDGATYDGLKEDDLALETSKLCVYHASLIEGIEPVLLRTDDVEMSFAQRNAAALAAGCHLVVAVHYDANPNPWARGAMTFSHPYNQRTEKIARNIAAKMPGELQPAKFFRTNAADWRKRAHRVVCGYGPPVVLVECARLTNEGDRALLRQHGFLGKIAKGICQGLTVAPEALKVSP